MSKTRSTAKPQTASDAPPADAQANAAPAGMDTPETHAAETQAPDPAGGAAVDDDVWAAALAEQAQAAPETDMPPPAAGSPGDDSPEDPPTDAATPRSAAAQLFPPLDAAAGAGGYGLERILDIPVELSVELGRTRLTLKNVLQLGQGSVVELDGLAGEPMDVYINGYLIAQGEVVVVDDKYGIRITDIITPSDRLARLNQRR